MLPISRHTTTEDHWYRNSWLTDPSIDADWPTTPISIPHAWLWQLCIKNAAPIIRPRLIGLAPVSKLTFIAIVDVTSLVTFDSAGLKGEKALMAYQLCANDSSIGPRTPSVKSKMKKENYASQSF